MGDPNGGPAFPSGEIDMDDCKTAYTPGMSLRDWFAGQAVTGFIGQVIIVEVAIGRSQTPDTAAVAKIAYEIADAMLAERSKP